ncbi:hypothetical protein XENTR_v10023484 [Xenopus tropicalis]|uniref:Uncharacterized protein LOC101732152 n=1 Tax=Xenopus tropicalis TaxID=8364 RepID=A0A8J0R7H0_XENTR|nr:uncharacterized protein LOC101732152 [Xenopus tropicalis]KAE8578362.1 hypothetical protein XENTR_v10023484 [Xenopus tropicalis]
MPEELIKKPLLGIFSRDHQANYEWLIDCLLKYSAVPDIRPVYIGNNTGLTFRDAVSKCTFAIVYHTLKRGRINITNVTDSLYDDELAYLCASLGKDNVIVVIDDLENISPDDRNRILEMQPSIGYLARDVFLFSTIEKERIPLGNPKKKNVIPDPKLAQLVDIIKGHHHTRKQCNINDPCKIGIIVAVVVIVSFVIAGLIYAAEEHLI